MSFLRILFLLPLLTPLARAQDPPVAPPPPGAQPANAQVRGKFEKKIEYRNAKGADIAELYTEWTGRRVLVTQAAADAEMTFIQNASPRNPLTYAEAAELLRKAAVLEGFVFTPHPDDPDLDILTVTPGGGARPNNIQVDVYNETTPLPEKDFVITYVMTLNYIKPDQAVQIFTQIVGQLGGYGSISSVPNASAVVITEKASLIKSLIRLKNTIDVPGSVQATRFIEVEHADATEVAAVITELMAAQQQAQQQTGVQRVEAAPAPQGGAPAPAGGNEGMGGVSTPVQIVADTRTNRIVAMGRPVDLIFVEDLARKFDIPASQKTFLKRKLRFLTVSEFLPIASDALERAFSGTGDGGGVTGGAAGQSSARPSSNANRTSNRNNNFGGGGGGNSAAGSISLDDPNISSAPESVLVGRTQLIADNITNTIIVQGPPSALAIVDSLISQLDVKPEQVMISTVIGQLTLTDSTELGFNYLVDGKDVQGGGGGSDFPVITPASPGDFPEFNPSSLVGSGLRVYGQIGDLRSYLRALSSKTDFTVLSRPSIFTTNNRKGVISSGERIAIPTEGGTSTGSFSSGTRIQYEDVVLKLEVIPLVNSKDEITMEIALLSDEQNGNQIIEGAGTNGGDLTVPRISTREILTTATVPNKETIVLGGLIVGRTNKDKTGIPILSDIPLVGGLFGTTTKGNDRSELLVFIQPSLVGE
ncbi:MAG: secretin N-terminal domain-containing protein, partial [Akkermansiaceae bacterium]|nr:secretin N-terminal domain-containing protein [Akkermansiaceae bacterium]